MLAHNPSVSADNIIVAPLGVASFWSEKIDAGALPLLLKRFPLLPDRLILLSVGRIEPRKGIAQSIEAIARLPEEIRRRITYLIVGRTIEVDYAHQLMEQISKHDMDIRMIGEVTKEELRGLYHTASLLLHTATRDQFRAEGFGLVLLEAAACGLPAVATKVDAIPEVIRDGVSGVLVDDRDIDAMSNVIGTLLSSKEALPALAVGCKTYSTHFTWDNYARTLLENARPLLRPSSGVDLPHD
jgi:glycosyltransferase involved in cell wall biosynthesis